MLLTSADTKSPFKHEEISANGSDNDNYDNNNNNNNSDGGLNIELSSLSADGITRCSSSADSTGWLAPPASEHRPAERCDEAPTIVSPKPTCPSDAGAGAERNSDEPPTQLSVSAEENSAFKDYMDALQMGAESDSERGGRPDAIADDELEIKKVAHGHDNDSSPAPATAAATVELRLLVRRREAGALIGKKGANIKRLRDTFRSSMFSIPDTGNGPERVVCISSDPDSIDPILVDIARLLVEKSPENDEQVELKLLIHSSHAGSIIGIGGQSIKRLRNESRAAIKIYEMCCPMSNERVCAIKARPPIVVSTIRLIQSILEENPIKGTIKPYDALHCDLSLIDKYGGYLPEEPLDLFGSNTASNAYAAAFGHESAAFHSQKQFNNPGWRPSADYCDPCEMRSQEAGHAFHQLPAGAIPGSKREQQQAALSAAAVAASQSDESQEAGARNKFGQSRHRSINRPAGSRFHPYAVGGANCHSSRNYPSHYRGPSNSGGHPSRSAALRYPSAFPASATAALIAAASAAAAAASASYHPSARASPYAHLAAGYQQAHHGHAGGPRASQMSASGARMVADQFACPSSGCRHLRPCLCMFLPAMHDGAHHHHQSSSAASMLATYTRMGLPEAGEELSLSQFHQQAPGAQQPRKEATNSQNGGTGGNSSNSKGK